MLQFLDDNSDELTSIEGGQACADFSGLTWLGCVVGKAEVDYIEGFVSGLFS